MNHYISERITFNPDLCNGKPTIRGHRITVHTVLEFLYAGDSKEEILEHYPFLEMEDIDACLQFALQMVDRKHIVKPIIKAA